MKRRTPTTWVYSARMEEYPPDARARRLKQAGRLRDDGSEGSGKRTHPGNFRRVSMTVGTGVYTGNGATGWLNIAPDR